MTDDTVAVHQHILSLLAAREARSILDLGCGRGEHLRMLAPNLPANARLVGVDNRESVLEEAREAVAGDPRFEFVRHDLSEPLPFSSREFSRVLSVNVLEAIEAKDAFAREVYRVLDPAGRFVCAHYDWESQLFDGPQKDVIRKIVTAYSEWQFASMAAVDGWMGRRLWRSFQGLDLFEGRVDAFTHTATRYEPGRYGWERAQDFRGLVKRGHITRAEYDSFVAGLAELAAQDRYFYAITMFSYSGAKRPGDDGATAPA